MKYCLEQAIPYTVTTEMLKNQTCQTIRWKQVALCDDLEALKGYKQKDMRIVNWETMNVVAKADFLYC